jgi:histone H1/5
MRRLKKYVTLFSFFLFLIPTFICQNTKPASKRSTVAKESQTAPIKAAPKTAAKKSRATKPVATTEPSAPLKSGAAEKKYHSTAKKARATGATTRRTAGRKASTARSTAKKVYVHMRSLY